jgi:hypothetical protein
VFARGLLIPPDDIRLTSAAFYVVSPTFSVGFVPISLIRSCLVSLRLLMAFSDVLALTPGNLPIVTMPLCPAAFTSLQFPFQTSRFLDGLSAPRQFLASTYGARARVPPVVFPVRFDRFRSAVMPVIVGSAAQQDKRK